MRRHGAAEARYVKGAETRRTLAKPGNWMDRVFIETEIRARAWSRKHGRRGMSAICWNALWERVRDELYGAAWSCEMRRSHAAAKVFGAEA